MSMRTNRRTKGKFKTAMTRGGFRRGASRQVIEQEAVRRAIMVIRKGFDSWQDLTDHESKEIKLSERYLVRMDHFYDDDIVYIDLYDFDSGEPPETIFEFSISED